MTKRLIKKLSALSSFIWKETPELKLGKYKYNKQI